MDTKKWDKKRWVREIETLCRDLDSHKAPWMWSTELPYDLCYRSAWHEWWFDAWRVGLRYPVILRGSRRMSDWSQENRRCLAEKFVRRAIRKLRVTTVAGSEMLLSKKNEINKLWQINRRMRERWPNVRVDATCQNKWDRAEHWENGVKVIDQEIAAIRDDDYQILQYKSQLITDIARRMKEIKNMEEL